MSHAKLSPSASSRWTRCTASVGFIEANKDNLPADSTVYADEGTKAHDLAKDVLTAKLLAAPESDMGRHVQAYCDFILKSTEGCRVLVERRVPLYYSPDEGGTVDAAAFSPGRMFIGDLKYGVGVSVDAVENTQLAIYAESIIRTHEEIFDISDDTEVSLNIFQPRDRNNPEPVRNWTLKRLELRDFLAKTVDAAVDVLRNRPQDATFVADPEKQCRFCPAKGICKAYALYGISDTPVAVEVFESPEKVFTLPTPDSVDRPTRIRVLQAAKTIKKWIEALEELERATLMGGAQPAGMKLVAGRSNRQWADEQAAAQLLKNYLDLEQIYKPRELISPAKAEELLKGIETSVRFTNRFESLVTKPEGGPTLVPESDKRPALELDQTKLLSVVQESETSE